MQNNSNLTLLELFLNFLVTFASIGSIFDQICLLLWAPSLVQLWVTLWVPWEVHPAHKSEATAGDQNALGEKSPRPNGGPKVYKEKPA